MTNIGIKAILFDLGGVLIQLGGISEVMGWTGWDPEHFWRRWLASPSVRQFEAGISSADEFGVRLVEEFELPVEADEFLAQFVAWPQGVYSGAEKLLNDAGLSYRVGCLSNTNSMHWEFFTQSTNLFGYFDFLFPSHQTGLLKPDSLAFTNAAEKMDLQPEQILFLDDNQINIKGAHEAGLHGYLVQGVDHARSTIQELGLI